MYAYIAHIMFTHSVSKKDSDEIDAVY